MKLLNVELIFSNRPKLDDSEILDDSHLPEDPALVPGVGQFSNANKFLFESLII
jgi:hypothetical protein